MHQPIVRTLNRRAIDRLNQGDDSVPLELAHPHFEVSFPGVTSWSTVFGFVERGRDRHVTHRGTAAAFADRWEDDEDTERVAAWDARRVHGR